ncbi:MAG: hypothetical protein HQK59_14505 [Deltaproteobacteria bacterium]|nr:hypothetical protein [Deltaproteobacteria bacterium]
MQYDVCTKVMMEKCRDVILRHWVGIPVLESRLIDPLPQETVSLKRSDYSVLVTDEYGVRKLVLLEIQTRWDKKIGLRMLDYRSRYLLEYELEAISCVLLLCPSPQAVDVYQDNQVTFRFQVIRVYDLDAQEIIDKGITCLAPFVPLMQHGRELIDEADKLIYESSAPKIDKADMLTAMAIFSGLISPSLPGYLVSKRRDIMIESVGYEVIKREGIIEGMMRAQREGIIEILHSKFGHLPREVEEKIRTYTDPAQLRILLINAATATSLLEFRRKFE